MRKRSSFNPTTLSKKNEQDITFHEAPNVHLVIEDEEERLGETGSAMGTICVFFFTLGYLIRPIHLIIPLLALFFGSTPWKIIAAPAALTIVLSFSLPPQMSSFWVRVLLGPMLEYFAYEEIEENTPINIQESMRADGKKYIFACQPHSVVPYCSIAWSVRRHQQSHRHPYRDRRSSSLSNKPIGNPQGIIPTVVPSLVLYTPILKHVMGLLGCVTLKQMKKDLAMRSAESKGSRDSSSSCSSVRLYVGSNVDIFLCTPEVEVVELTKRKKFIFLALQLGMDVIPVYMFGNTATLSVVSGNRHINPWLIRFSRWFKTPVTYVMGRYGLPFLPKKQRLLYVSGQPLGIPHLKHPRPSQVDFWHKRYCEQVQRLFDEYKERVPSYKNKSLVIV